MADEVIVNGRVSIPASELEFTASRASGPGGQHVNTSDTRIQLRWNVVNTNALGETQRRRVLAAFASRLTDAGDLILASGMHRSQRRNREEVIDRLVGLLRRALVPPRPRRATRPTRASREKRLEEKKRRGATKKRRGDGGRRDD